MAGHRVLRRTSQVCALVGSVALIGATSLCFAVGFRYGGYAVLGALPWVFSGIGGGLVLLAVAAILSGLALRREPGASPPTRRAAGMIYAGGWTMLAAVGLAVSGFVITHWEELVVVSGMWGIAAGGALALVGHARALRARRAPGAAGPPEGPY